MSDFNQLEVRNLIQRGRILHAEFEVPYNTGTICETYSSPEYILNGVVKFQVQVIVRLLRGCSYEYNNLVFVKCTKRYDSDNSDYTVKFSCKKFKINEKHFRVDNSTWRLIKDLESCYNFAFDVTAVVETIGHSCSFATIRDDNILTDFELRSADGSVQVHKAVLAASSPVLRRMLEGEWHETRIGCVDIPGTSKTTLEHFKDYMYLHTLPDSGLEQLLLLASYYMMPDLEQKCVDKLMTKINAQNALSMSEFAVKHQMRKLHLAVFECFQSGTVKVEEINEDCLGLKRKNEHDDIGAKKIFKQESP